MDEKIEVGSLVTLEHGKRGNIINILVEEIDTDGTIYGIDCDGSEYEIPFNARWEILTVEKPINSDT